MTQKKTLTKATLNSRLEIRLPEETKRKLSDYCTVANTSSSEFIRQIIDDGDLPDVRAMSIYQVKKAMLEPLITELSRIGNNLNQSVRTMHLTRQLYELNRNNPKLSSELDQSAFILSCLTTFNHEVELLRKARTELQQLMKDLIKWSGENVS